MKRFIDEKGLFEITVPITWRYSLINKKVHTFKEYEIWKSDAFQLSILNLNNRQEKNNLLNITKSLPVSIIGNLNYYCFPDTVTKDFTTKKWAKIIEDKAIIFTLTFTTNPDKKLDNRSLKAKIKTAYSVICTFRLINENECTAEINSYRLDMFLQGVGATSLILNNAIENKAFIEATCIIANQIDALLRIGIILKNQIINRNKEIEISWIYQGLSDKKKTEKDIYNKSLDLGIIEKAIYDKLYNLYDDRNRVIHRFIISEITLAEVEGIAYEYHLMSEVINTIIYNLESEQIRLKIGMTIKNGEIKEVSHLDYIKGKIGKQNYFNNKKFEK